MRTWVDTYKPKPVDKRWVMRCEGSQLTGHNAPACTATSEPFDQQPDLGIFIARGWFIAALSGDMCPACRAAGRADGIEPHPLMEATAATEALA